MRDSAHKCWLATLALFSVAACSQEAVENVVVKTPRADAIYHNGTVLTVNDEQPTAEAVAVREGKIVAVGAEADVLLLAGEQTRKIDLGGKTLLPGFFDSHGHAYGIGLQALSANLLPPPDGDGADVPSLQKLLNEWVQSDPVLLEKVGWIVGFGYDDSQLAEQRHPTRDELDRVSTEVPVIIIHQSGHLGVANSKALERVGLTAESEDPKGGVIRRRAGSREPNGVLEEYAFFFVLGAIAGQFDDSVNELLVTEGTGMLASFGYTTAQEGRANAMGLNAMKSAADNGLLKIDLVAYPDILEVDDIQPTAEYSGRYRVGGAKLTIDGSPQGKTAWLTEPYYVPPEGQGKDYVGYAAVDEETTFSAVEKAIGNGWQILCHANGDAAIDRFVEAVRRAEAKHPEADVRPVLIHGQTLRADQVAGHLPVAVPDAHLLLGRLAPRLGARPRTGGEHLAHRLGVGTGDDLRHAPRRAGRIAQFHARAVRNGHPPHAKRPGAGRRAPRSGGHCTEGHDALAGLATFRRRQQGQHRGRQAGRFRGAVEQPDDGSGGAAGRYPGARDDQGRTDRLPGP
jgi:predicted amidohydrolase YtcJ